MAADTRRSVLLRFCRQLMQAQQKCQSDGVGPPAGAWPADSTLAHLVKFTTHGMGI